MRFGYVLWLVAEESGVEHNVDEGSEGGVREAQTHHQSLSQSQLALEEKKREREVMNSSMILE